MSDKNIKSNIDPIPEVPPVNLGQELTPFQICVKQNFPFIENTFQAEDTYSLICQIVGYLNKVIENQNLDDEAIKTAYNTLNTFRDYMDNYFTNLDVQDEINNKLNTMASNGSLQAIFTQVFNNTNPKVVSSISQMTDVNQIYILSTDKNWYYNNGNNFVSGGLYMAEELAELEVKAKNLSNNTQTMLNYRYPLGLTVTNNQYRNYNGNVINNPGVSHTSSFELKKGETVIFTAKALTNGALATLAQLDSEGNFIRTLIRSYNNSIQHFKYTAIEDMYCDISYETTNAPELDLGIYYSEIHELNRLNLGLITNSYYINVNTGNPTSYPQNRYSITDFIEIEENIPIYYYQDLLSLDSVCGVCFYNENKNYISGVSLSTTENFINFVTPQNTKYLRATLLTMAQNTIYMQLNETLFDISNKVNNLTQNTLKDNLFSSFIKVGIIGDSLSNGCSVYQNNGNKFIDFPENSWGMFLNRLYGMNNILFAKGGLTTRTWLSNPIGLTALLKPENLCKAYIIGLGVNDKQYGDDYIGTIEDIKTDYNTNPDSFYGNYGKIIGNILNIQPRAKIFLFTAPINYSTQDYTLINEAIRNIANHFNSNCFLIDLALNYQNEYDTGFLKLNTQAAHYTCAGYEYMANFLMKILSNYMYVNYNNFKDIQFIGTDLYN